MRKLELRWLHANTHTVCIQGGLCCPVLRLRISCWIHRARHCAWMAFPQKEEIMVEFPFSGGEGLNVLAWHFRLLVVWASLPNLTTPWFLSHVTLPAGSPYHTLLQTNLTL